MPDVYHTTRATLLERVRDLNDKQSWKEFYHLYQPLIYRYARHRGLDREYAEELTQQCLVQLVDTIPRFEYAREKGGFKAWLRRMANHKIIDHFKKRKLPVAKTADFRRPQTCELEPDELWEHEWQKRHLQYFLSEIREEVAPATFQIFDCHVLQEWPVEKVVEMLKVTTDQVYAAKSRITRRLRTKMRESIGT